MLSFQSLSTLEILLREAEQGSSLAPVIFKSQLCIARNDSKYFTQGVQVPPKNVSILELRFLFYTHV
jgi:hypothetical protein